MVVLTYNRYEVIVMPDYRQMHCTLFNAVITAIHRLQNARIYGKRRPPLILLPYEADEKPKDGE